MLSWIVALCTTLLFLTGVAYASWDDSRRLRRAGERPRES